MGESELALQDRLDLRAMSPSHLIQQYSETIEALRKCANLDPSQETAGTDKREADLLDYEASLLEQGARVELSSEDDIRALTDLWAMAASLQTEGDVRPSDRIAMNIFRHMSDVKFTKFYDFRG